MAVFFSFILFCFVFEPQPAMLNGYSWFCTQELLLVVGSGDHMGAWDRTRPAACKTIASPAVLSFQLRLGSFIVAAATEAVGICRLV